MRARWQHPTTGSFLSVDPIVGAFGDPQRFNAYAYGRSNPVLFVDPDGENPVVWALAGAALVYLLYGSYSAYNGAVRAARENQAANAEVAANCIDFGPGCEPAAERQAIARKRLLESTKDIALNTPGTSWTGPPPTSAVDLITDALTDMLIGAGMSNPENPPSEPAVPPTSSPPTGLPSGPVVTDPPLTDTPRPEGQKKVVEIGPESSLRVLMNQLSLSTAHVWHNL
jgi:hypothetical protein